MLSNHKYISINPATYFCEPTLVIWEDEGQIDKSAVDNLFKPYVDPSALRVVNNFAEAIKLLRSGEVFSRAAIYIHGTYFEDFSSLRFSRSIEQNIAALSEITDLLKASSTRFFYFSMAEQWTSFYVATLCLDETPQLINKAEFNTKLSKFRSGSKQIKSFFSISGST